MSFINLTRRDYGRYGIADASCGNNPVPVTDGKSVAIPRAMPEKAGENEVSIILHIK